MELKVLHISGESHYQGGERQLSYLLKMLRHPVHHEVICVKGSRLENFCHDHDVPCHAYKDGFFKRFRMLALILKATKHGRFKILHCHDSRAHTGAWLSFKKIPILIHRRASHRLSRTPLNMLKFRSKRLQAIVCPSYHVAELVSEVVHRHEIIRVIYSSIDNGQFAAHQRKGQLRKELGLTGNKILIGTVGMVRPRKDLPTFVGIAEILMANNLNAHFVIVGEGADLDDIKQLIKEKNLQEHISLLGFRSDVPTILPDFDVFLLTTKAEGFSTVILEAFASGVPVVASSVGGLTEIVEEEISGLLAQPGNPQDFVVQITRLLKTPKLSEKLVNNAQALLDKFEADRMAKKYKKLYQQLAEKY